MTFDEHLSGLIRAAVAEAMVPVVRELAELRADRQEQGVTIEDAAGRLNVSTRTIQRMIKAGKLATVPGMRPPRVLLSAVLERAS